MPFLSKNAVVKPLLPKTPTNKVTSKSKLSIGTFSLPIDDGHRHSSISIPDPAKLKDSSLDGIPGCFKRAHVESNAPVHQQKCGEVPCAAPKRAKLEAGFSVAGVQTSPFQEATTIADLQSQLKAIKSASRTFEERLTAAKQLIRFRTGNLAVHSLQMPNNPVEPSLREKYGHLLHPNEVGDSSVSTDNAIKADKVEDNAVRNSDPLLHSANFYRLNPHLNSDPKPTPFVNGTNSLNGISEQNPPKEIPKPSRTKPLLTIRSRRKCTTDKDGNQWKCDYCKKPFNSLEAAVHHEIFLKHVQWTDAEIRKSGYKVFNCTLCDQIFSRNANLKRHLPSHLHNSDFACNICQRRFTHKTNLRNHIRNIHNKSKYRCNWCGVIFVDSTRAEHQTNGHIPSFVPIFACNDLQQIVLRSQNLLDRLEVGDNIMRNVYVIPLQDPKGNWHMAVSITSHWNVVNAAWRRVNDCLAHLPSTCATTKLLQKFEGCTLRFWLENGWIAYPDLAFRLGPPIKGYLLSNRFKWLHRTLSGECFVLAPADCNELLLQAVGPQLIQHYQHVKEVFPPSDSDLALATPVNRNYVPTRQHHIKIPSPFRDSSSVEITWSKLS